MNKLTITDYLKMKYPYTIDENGGDFYITVSDLPGCSTYGKTIEEALKNKDDAIYQWLEYCIKMNKTIPLPNSSFGQNGYSGQFMVRTSSSLHAKISQIAENEGVSLNHLVTNILSEYTGGIDASEKVMNHLEGIVVRFEKCVTQLVEYSFENIPAVRHPQTGHDRGINYCKTA
ncbi:MAG: type II toxin-antitoxin system HicB family antitoxin [Candidatus Delongbacteria bacterium]|nr:type II toxin-antitoxin system HicB family antitoxin [Candidatus Delongbacteria bacterium]